MKFNNIYVLCPKGVKTGGPELLHQLVYQINQVGDGRHAFIAYYGDLSATPVDEYKKYINNAITFKDIQDSSDNVIVFPETAFTDLFNLYTNAHKYIWWLSVDNYFSYNSPSFSLKTDGLLYTLGRFVKGHLKNNLVNDRKIFKKTDLHLCQSYYAENYLSKHEHIPFDRIKYLSDYINDFYVNKSDEALKHKKENIILYNPKKGYRFTKKIIKASQNKGWKWIALKGMSNSQIQHYLESSKVYIDFGNHPGKDRLPREAAILGCCVITGKKGAAFYHQDVPLLKKYKFDNNAEAIPLIIRQIEFCLDNYQEVIDDFASYRKYIKDEKRTFESDIKKIFG